MDGTDSVVDGSSAAVGTGTPNVVADPAAVVFAPRECRVVSDEMLLVCAAPPHAISNTDADTTAITRIDVGRRVTSIHPNLGEQNPLPQGYVAMAAARHRVD